MERSDCAAAREAIPDLVSGELPEEARREVERHLGSCPGCRLAEEAEKATRGRLRGLSIPPPPVSLARALDTLPAPALAGPDAATKRFPRRVAILRRVPVAAAAALLLAAGLLLFGPPGPVVPVALAAAADTYQEYMDGKIRLTAPADSAAALEKILGTEASAGGIPALEAEGFRVQGACPCGTRGRASVPMILYRREETLVGLVAVPARDVALDPGARRDAAGLEYYAFRARGKTILACPSGPLLHLWVSTLPEAGLVRAALSTPEGRRETGGVPITLPEMTCRACCARVERAVRAVPGVEGVEFDLANRRAVVRMAGGQPLPEEARRRLREMGFTPEGR